VEDLASEKEQGDPESSDEPPGVPQPSKANNDSPRDPPGHKGAVTAGIFAIAGALIGGGITGGVTYFTTSRQLASSASQSSISFYREQKLRLYTKMLEDAINADHQIGEYSYQFAVTPDPGSPDFLKLKTDTYHSLGAIKDDYEAIRLVGGDRVITAARDVWTKMSARVVEVDNLYARWAYKSLSELDRSGSFHPQTTSLEAEEQKAQDAFVDAARNDLRNTV
jgi:hypothetical protein